MVENVCDTTPALFAPSFPVVALTFSGGSSLFLSGFFLKFRHIYRPTRNPEGNGTNPKPILPPYCHPHGRTFILFSRHTLFIPPSLPYFQSVRRAIRPPKRTAFAPKGA